MVRTVHTTIEIKKAVRRHTTANGQPFYLLQHGFKDIAIFAIMSDFGIPELGSIEEFHLTSRWDLSQGFAGSQCFFAPELAVFLCFLAPFFFEAFYSSIFVF